MRHTSIFAAILFLLLSNSAGFACRLEGMMGIKNPSPATLKEEEQFLHRVLLNDPNSLQRESAKREPKDGNHEIFDLEDLSGVLRKYGSPDGWGIVSYACPAVPLQLPKVVRGTVPAYKDEHFKQAAIQPEQTRSSIFLAHVRLASLTAKATCPRPPDAIRLAPAKAVHDIDMIVSALWIDEGDFTRVQSEVKFISG